MKQKDLVTIVVVALFSGILSLLVSKIFISTPANRALKVEVVESIKSDFPHPDKRYFNDKSINPTQLITIGDSANTKPFN